MKALSVRQPWAELIAQGRKSIELRSWSTSYRGPLLIVAGRNWHSLGVELHGSIGARGVSVCVGTLHDVRPATARDAQKACVRPPSVCSGLLAWELRDVVRVAEVPVIGRLSLFDVTPEVLARLQAPSPRPRTQTRR